MLSSCSMSDGLRLRTINNNSKKKKKDIDYRANAVD